MKILISDTISQNGIDSLKQAGLTVAYEPEVTPADLIIKVADCEGLVVRSRTKVTKEILVAASKLKIIGRVGSGIDNIDKKTANDKGITIVNAPDANSQAVVEAVIGMILNLLRKFPRAAGSMKNGEWIKNDLTGVELSGKTVGIVGYGNIGKRVDSICRAFGAATLVYSRSFKTSTLSDVFARSDVVTIHISYNEETKGMIAKNLLNSMKASSYFLNFARPEVVDQEALYDLLLAQRIEGAAIDVFPVEPLPADSPWRRLENVLLTPHIGASTKEALERASEEVVGQIIEFFKGESQSVK